MVAHADLELLSIISDPDYGDITDLKSGRDVDVTYLTPKEAGNQYGSTKVRVKPSQTESTEDTDVAKMIMEEQPDIYDIFKKKSYDELKEALERWLDPEKFAGDENAVSANIEKARRQGGVETSSTDNTEDRKDLPWEKEDENTQAPAADEKQKPSTDAEAEFDKLFKDES